ncbi:MAG TPA: stage II sporulation protein M [Lachnospiraceae bacterium]|nr:stage II sporulation protein M [Lachnospiraceae bacterium]
MFLKKNFEKKNRALILIMGAGFLLGLFLMNIGKKALLENTDLLSEYTLYEMKYAVIDGNAFFWYVLQKRVGMVLILALLSTTWLGMAATWAYAAWLGVCGGMLVMAALIRYGLKGIFLILVGLFPQGIIYFPVVILLLHWSYEFCMTLYFPYRLSTNSISIGEDSTKGVLIRKKVLQLLILLGVVIIGCFLESYVNPKLVLSLLKIF